MRDASDEYAVGPDQAAPVRVRRPWWLPHFLGRVPVGLNEKHVALVGVIAISTFFENYDVSMLSAALKQIRESFGLSSEAMASLIAYTRLGAIPAFLVLPLADRIGRRRVFLWALGGMSVATFLTAFTRTPTEFVAMQLLARMFLVATIAVAIVIVAEELPAEHRGWGIGTLGAIGSLGYGLGALVYAFVDALPFGWRALYVVGLIPALLMPVLRRRVPETQRFLSMRASAEMSPTGWARPFLEMLRVMPVRSLGVAAMAGLFAAGSTPAFGLISDFVQTSRGWSPANYSVMAIVAGMFGIVGNTAMGWSADRWGRRPVGIAIFGLFPLMAYGIYFGPGAAIALIWVPLVFLLTGGIVLMRTITSELFPTSSRNTAMGWAALFETLGASFGFFCVALLARGDESFAGAVVGVSALTILAAIVVWTFPETARRELESTSGGSSVTSSEGAA